MIEQFTTQIKSKERVAAHGEVFTAEREVKAMCDLVADECLRIESRFLEPACGNGNFLAEILRRKLSTCPKRYGTPPLPDYERSSVNAVMSLYGIELLQDNAKACRNRLFNIWHEAYQKACGKAADETCQNVIEFILGKNIICGDALTMKQEDGTPIVFAEWTFLNDGLVKRRDFRLDQLIQANEQTKAAEKAQQGWLPFGIEGISYDKDTGEYIPKVEEYPPIHYRSLCEHG